jgi:quinol monooxygenase YgiN
MEETTMRKMVLSFLAFGALAVPAYAQAPQHGEKTGYIATTYTAEVLPGQMDKFKQLVPAIIAATAKEPGTLIYEWNMRADGKTFDVVELYQSSDAMIAHVNHVVPEFGKTLGEVQKTTSFVIYGSPSEAAKKAIAGFNPTYNTPIDGFTR